MGRQIGVESDILSTGAGVDSYTSYEYNLWGHLTKTVLMDGSRNIINQFELERNLYGQNTKTAYLKKNGEIDWTRAFTFDAYGRTIREQDDRTVIGKWDKDDSINELTLSDDARGLMIHRKIISYSPTGDVTKNIVYTHDDYGRVSMDFEDRDDNKKLSDSEVYSLYFYEGQSTFAHRYDTMIFNENGDDRLSHIVKVTRLGNNTILSRFVSNNKGEFETLFYDGWGAVKSSVEDYTTEHFQTLFDTYGGKLKRLALSNATQSTKITFDNDTLAKLSGQTTNRELLIDGDATDTIRLKDSSEFEKQTATVKRGANDYYQYNTEVNGKAYTLLIDTDIKVELL